jgi:hypothetical protein
MTRGGQLGAGPLGRPLRQARVLALLLAIFWGYLFYGITDLLVFAQGPEFHQSFHLETNWGLFFLFLIAAPLVSVAIRRPRSGLPTALQQVLLGGVSVLLGAALSASAMHLLLVVGLVGTAVIVAWCAPTGPALLISRSGRWRCTTGALVVAAIGPCCAYAWASAYAARHDPTPSVTVGLSHGPVLAALALDVVLVAALAARLPDGWVVPTWTVGICTVWVGVDSLIYPDLEAGLSRPWAVAAMIWGILFVAAAHRSARQSMVSP